jgi:hypothetical protein
VPGSLGVPWEYEAFIVDSLTQETVDVLPWTSIEWNRSMNGASKATISCRRQRSIRPKWYDLQPLRAWDRMVVITRNGFPVWDGPILGWSSSSSLTVEASDRSVALGKRLLASDIVLTDLASTFRLYSDLLSPAITASGLLTTGAGQMPYAMSVSTPTSPIPIDNVRPIGAYRFNQLLTLQAMFEGLSRSAFLCWSQQRQNLLLFVDRYGATTNFTTGAVTPWGTLRPEYIVSDTGDIGVTARADDMATGVYKGDTGQGIAGFPNSVVPFNTLTYTPYALYGTLADASTEEIYWTNEALSARVDPQQYVSAAPTLTLEQVQLSADCYLEDEDFLADLTPGRVIRLDFPNSWGLNTPIVSRVPSQIQTITTVYADRINYARIDDVAFSVSRSEEVLTEKVTLSMTARATA